MPKTLCTTVEELPEVVLADEENLEFKDARIYKPIENQKVVIRWNSGFLDFAFFNTKYGYHHREPIAYTDRKGRSYVRVEQLTNVVAWSNCPAKLNIFRLSNG